MNLEDMLSENASNKRPHISWFHLHEICKSTETESRLGARGRKKQSDSLKAQDFLLGWWKSSRIR